MYHNNELDFIFNWTNFVLTLYLFLKRDIIKYFWRSCGKCVSSVANEWKENINGCLLLWLFWLKLVAFAVDCIISWTVNQISHLTTVCYSASVRRVTSASWAKQSVQRAVGDWRLMAKEGSRLQITEQLQPIRTWPLILRAKRTKSDGHVFLKSYSVVD